MKPTKHCLKKGKGEGGEYNEGVNLFKVHCEYVWHYHNEIPSYY
jgi:hypothetical protein